MFKKRGGTAIYEFLEVCKPCGKYRYTITTSFVLVKGSSILHGDLTLDYKPGVGKRKEEYGHMGHWDYFWL